MARKSTPITRERILGAAETVIRRQGLNKTTVLDVARGLGISHGTLYKHFPDKDELHRALLVTFLDRFTAPIDTIMAMDASATDRLYRWLRESLLLRQVQVRNDPEIFRATSSLTVSFRGLGVDYRAARTLDVQRIVDAGIASGEFSVADPHEAAFAIINAFTRFFNPAHQHEWLKPDIDPSFEGVWKLVIGGLSKRP